MPMLKLSKVFDIQYGHSLELNRLKRCGPQGIPFVSRKMGDNGIAAYVELIPGVMPNPAGDMTCALSGNGVLSTFIQERPYYTGFHVACLRPKETLSKQELLYYCTCIKANRYRYSFGRQANRSLKEILVPAPDDIPAWMKSVNIDLYKRALDPVSTTLVALPPLDRWEWFRLEELFEIKKGRRLTKANQVSGSVPFIGAIDKNNGLAGRIGQNPIHDGNTITVNYNGSVAEAFYQPIPFWASDDVNVLYPKFDLTPYVAMFIIALIRREKYRFNYGRKWHLERMNSSLIKLPIKSDGSPHWPCMESYIKSLAYSSQIR